MPMNDELRLNPGETEAHALKRRITMHEFLMTGGVQIGYQDGKMAYSPAIGPDEREQCPFHEDVDCIAWREIREGRGHWTRLEAELSELEAELVDAFRKPVDGPDDDEIDALMIQVAEAREALALRPRSITEIREKNARDEWAGSQDVIRPTGGDPWNRKSTVGGSNWREEQENGLGYGAASRPYAKPRLEDARDTAVSELSAAANIPHEIEIEGDEDDDETDATG